MLDGLEARTGREGGATVVMDRGFASADNLKLVRTRHYDYLVAGFQQQRGALQNDFEDLEGWEAITPSANKVPVQIKRVGYFLEQHRDLLAVDEAVLASLEGLRPSGVHYLDPREGGRLVQRWNLIVPERFLPAHEVTEA